MINEKFYYIIILVFSGIPLINLSYSINGNLETYSNAQMGLEFKYPSSWELSQLVIRGAAITTDKDCDPFCDVSFDIPSDGLVPVIVHSYNLKHLLYVLNVYVIHWKNL